MASREGGAASLGSVLGPVLGCSSAGMEQGQGGPFHWGLVRRRDAKTPLDLDGDSIPGSARGRGCSVLGGKASLPRLTQPAQPLQSPEEPGERRGWQKQELWEDEGS